MSLRKRVEVADRFAEWESLGGAEREFCCIYNLDKTTLRRYVKAANKLAVSGMTQQARAKRLAQCFSGSCARYGY